MASRSTTKLLCELSTTDAGFEAKWAQVCEREAAVSANVDKEVRKVIERVRKGGDAEVLACVKKLDGASIDALEVTRDEWDEGCDSVDPADRAAIGKASMRIREFHRKRIPSSWEMREEGGAYMGQRVRPLQCAGLFVPGGGVPVPSSVIMNAVPASVVEVPEIVMATPPMADGRVCPEVLIAARVSGVHRVFKMGGAHAVAAMALGTVTVPRVDKIVGLGDPYVSTAKRLLFGDVAIDSEAGPGEVCMIADRSATPAWLAADLISKVEQDELAQAVLITHLKTLAKRVQDQLSRQLKTLERSEAATRSLSTRGAVILTRNLEESTKLANEYAPEHLVLATESPELVMKQVVNAGAIFLGHYTPVAVGDYLAGPNHVLPTGGTARFDSPLGVEDFLKRMTFMKFESPKLRELGADVIRLAEVEGLQGHGKAVDLRLQKIRRARREREAAREMEMEL